MRPHLTMPAKDFFNGLLRSNSIDLSDFAFPPRFPNTRIYSANIALVKCEKTRRKTLTICLQRREYVIHSVKREGRPTSNASVHSKQRRAFKDEKKFDPPAQRLRMSVSLD